jgi:hypothetical protein
MSSTNALLNESFLKSLETDNPNAIDTLYVNTVVASIRNSGTAAENRGILWENLHKSLLQLKSSRAALESVAEAEGDADLETLKTETRVLFDRLKQECSSFAGDWGSSHQASSSIAVAVPTTNLPPLPQHRRQTSIIDRALGKKNRTTVVSKHVSTWTYQDRQRMATQLLQILRNLGVFRASTSTSHKTNQILIAFVRDYILLRIEPCKEYCLTSCDVSNLVVDLLISSNSSRLPLPQRNKLSSMRGSSVLSGKIGRVFVEYTHRKGNGRSKSSRTTFNNQRQLKFRCSSLTIEAANFDTISNINIAQCAKDADGIADQILHALNTMPMMSPMNCRRSFEECKTIPVYM